MECVLDAREGHETVLGDVERYVLLLECGDDGQDAEVVVLDDEHLGSVGEFEVFGHVGFSLNMNALGPFASISPFPTAGAETYSSFI